MREQDQRVANMRENRMRDEQIISVAGIAAGTAHEMRTPLATMTVAIEELSDDHPELREELALLQGQVDRCDSILRELVSSTTGSSELRASSIGQFVEDIQEKWMIARPEVPLAVDVPPSAAGLEIEHDQSLYHAVMSFLHNAAEASPGDVRLSVRAAADSTVWFRLEDRGPGIPDDVAAGLGRRHASGKEDGLGLGVLLSTASVERLGGEVLLSNRPGGGARVDIHLPARS
jgi:two-component system sensor histidine kinase RegB